MSIRPTRRRAVLAAVAVTVSLTGAAGATTASAAVRPATFIGIEDGYGPTLADAQATAGAQMNADYTGCKRPYFLVSDGQIADGTWWARVEANGCTGYR
ncbi:hypothetical protein Caci_6629 [Catenulispora acidiphila DSM 44928]|uniref:Uncharacterized protein n=1 Tax=Catenulispora acidiphila (strain DSM 44928 / JCM 14897 / NBRC 102108 / NRRL B-24433 / ID139908) TaxID=479433 RepID=C7PZY2_CATAD|nr:hypothetical protein [Catenulispora acidiphila]ACU75475.1 hypothetical protein Caci_6629 [Catenulispora acidiphila DSM 44928]